MHNFDERFVRVKQKTRSTTQGECKVFYCDRQLGNSAWGQGPGSFGDDPQLGDDGIYRQRSPRSWIDFARRETATLGLTYPSIPPGYALQNGRIAIASRAGVVLAVCPLSATPYAIWTLDKENQTHNGDYHTDLNAALEAFNERAGE